jgi:hypothetical protein
MRSSQWLLGLATASSTIVAVVAAGCGGSSSNGTPAKDAATDVTTDVVVEAGSEASVDATDESACTTDADITSLTIPDASIGDGGGSTDGCYACIQSTCGAQLTACNQDCTCKGDALTLFQCLASGQSTTACLGPLATGGFSDPAVLEIGLCLGGSAIGGTGAGCLAQCGVSIPDGGFFPEGGPPSDAGTDADHDAGHDAAPKDAAKD